MSSIICQRPCYFKCGEYCKKEFVMLNQLGQCEEHWNKMGQPILMRDPTVGNVMKDKETIKKPFKQKDEKNETEGKKTDEEICNNK